MTVYVSGTEFYTAKEVAEHFGVSLSTIQNWERTGKITIHRHPQGDKRDLRLIDKAEFARLEKEVQVRADKKPRATSSSTGVAHIEKFIQDMYLNTEWHKMQVFLEAFGITTLDQVKQLVAGAVPSQTPKFTPPMQPAKDIPAARFNETMSTPTMLLKDEEPKNVFDKLKSELESKYTYWSSPLDAPDERLPIDPESVDMMFEAWIESPSHPEITCRADVNVDNGIEAVKGAGHLLWTSEV